MKERDMSLRLLVCSFLLIGCSIGAMNHGSFAVRTKEELEETLKTLNKPEGMAVQWNRVVEDCLLTADDLLDNYFDYRGSIEWINHAITVCDVLKRQGFAIPHLRSLEIRSYTGIAWAYHNIGKNDQRDFFMKKAQELLNIPDDISQYKESSFDRQGCNYFVIDGYRYYIRYEQTPKESIDMQEEYLRNGEQCFLKALAIADKFELGVLTQGHAKHGLGTIYEFLGKCQQARHNNEKLIDFLFKSINAFQKAAQLREEALGSKHPHVARSLHKLARNFCLLGDVNQNYDFIRAADQSYGKADEIFEESKVPAMQAKRAEFSLEYTQFKEKHNLGQ
jgi:hypothetical protein